MPHGLMSANCAGLFELPASRLLQRPWGFAHEGWHAVGKANTITGLLRRRFHRLRLTRFALARRLCRRLLLRSSILSTGTSTATPAFTLRLRRVGPAIGAAFTWRSCILWCPITTLLTIRPATLLATFLWPWLPF